MTDLQDWNTVRPFGYLEVRWGDDTLPAGSATEANVRVNFMDGSYGEVLEWIAAAHRLKAVWLGDGRIQIGGGEPITLSPRGAELVQVLVESPGQTATTTELMDRLATLFGWDDPNAICQTVKRLPAKVRAIIRCPGKKGNGGYSILARAAN